MPEQPALSLRTGPLPHCTFACQAQRRATVGSTRQGPAPGRRGYLWRPGEGVFEDYDFTRARPSSYAYITSLYPLWAGVATREQAAEIVKKLNLFERPGGLSMSSTNTGTQWDEPFGWAPTNWIGVAGLEAEGFHADAARVAKAFDATVDGGFAQDGTIREKYNVVSSNSDVQVNTGYKVNVIGFGWTNAVYLKMKEVAGTR